MWYGIVQENNIELIENSNVYVAFIKFNKPLVENHREVQCLNC